MGLKKTEWLLVGVGFLLLTLFVVWPLPLHLTTHVILVGPEIISILFGSLNGMLVLCYRGVIPSVQCKCLTIQRDGISPIMNQRLL